MALGDQVKSDINRKLAGLYALASHIGKDLERESKSSASWIDRTGNTRRAIHGGADKTHNGAVLYLAHGSMVGTYLEEGTKPYIIRPKNKKALRFVSGGETIFVKRVNHPGIKARPVVGPTVESNWPNIKRQVRKYWEST